MNLHLSIDDKFYNAFISNQKKYTPKTKNEYVVISKGKKTRNPPGDTSVKTSSLAEIKKVLKNSGTRKYRQIFFHSLPGSFRKYLLHLIPEGITIT